MSRIRTFLAVDLGEAAREALAGLLSALKKQAPTVKWIRPENLHWTLAFLGEVEEARIEDAHQACLTATQTTPAFTLALGALGRFPAKGSPRVIWLGLSQGAEALSALQARLSESLKEKDFQMEDREFLPHLTLGRVPRDVRLQQDSALLQTTLPETGSQRVREVLVMRSDLSPAGAKYTKLHRCPLFTNE